MSFIDFFQRRYSTCLLWYRSVTSFLGFQVRSGSGNSFQCRSPPPSRLSMSSFESERPRWMGVESSFFGGQLRRSLLCSIVHYQVQQRKTRFVVLLESWVFMFLGTGFFKALFRRETEICFGLYNYFCFSELDCSLFQITMSHSNSTLNLVCDSV